MQPLKNKVALVTGASRGGGQGIAFALGEAGATVYVTGRSVRNHQTTDQQNANIDATAEQIAARGGVGIPVRVDHTVDEQVEALFSKIQNEQNRLDAVICNAWGGYETPEGFWKKLPFWELPLEQWDRMHKAGLRSHMTTSRFAIPLMLTQGHGLIIHTTTGMTPTGKRHGNLFYDTTKIAINRMSLGIAEDCQPHGVAVLLLSLGDPNIYMRTWEPNENTRPEDLAGTFTPEYAGRAIAALIADPNVMAKSGTAPYLEVPALARVYGFTDIDGTQP